MITGSRLLTTSSQRAASAARACVYEVVDPGIAGLADLYTNAVLYANVARAAIHRSADVNVFAPSNAVDMRGAIPPELPPRAGVIP